MIEYREITAHERTVVQAGDQYRIKTSKPWIEMESCYVGSYYNECDFYSFDYRRPIAYSSDTAPIIENLMGDVKGQLDGLSICTEPPDGQAAAVKTLEKLGYTYHGGELWKPPIGDAPDYLQDNPQEWVEGELPPIGVECEMLDDYGEFVEVKIFGNEDGFAAGWVKNPTSKYRRIFYSNKPSEFRPLNHEQLAADEEREEFALEMCRDSGMFGYGENLTANDAREIYDWLKSKGRLADKEDV